MVSTRQMSITNSGVSDYVHHNSAPSDNAANSSSNNNTNNANCSQSNSNSITNSNNALATTSPSATTSFTNYYTGPPARYTRQSTFLETIQQDSSSSPDHYGIEPQPSTSVDNQPSTHHSAHNHMPSYRTTRAAAAAASSSSIATYPHVDWPSSHHSNSGSSSNNHTSTTGSSSYSVCGNQSKRTTTASAAVYSSTVTIMDLPQEIIEKIFSYLTFKNVCHLRLVSRKFDSVASHLLNLSFQKFQVQMQNRFQTIKRQMPKRESARRNHPLACECDIIETIYMRLTLLQMSFGKHIERKHCCFFPGEILDEVYNILHHIQITPKLQRPYKVYDELFDLSTMAMEYFKEVIEPNLPEITYFGADFLDFNTFPNSGSNKYLAIDSSPLSESAEETKESLDHRIDHHGELDHGDDQHIVPIVPQSNMVLRKRIRKIKQGMKRYNSQLSILKQDLRSCKRKTAEQQRQISDQQRQLADQQKQTVEYATRLDEYDKKNDEISRKFSTLLQELNKCKTELQYWRSKSPATPPFCNNCGSAIISPPDRDELEALINQGVLPRDLEPLAVELVGPQLIAPIVGIVECTLDAERTKTTSDPQQQQVQIDATSSTTSAGLHQLKEVAISVDTTKEMVESELITTSDAHHHHHHKSGKRKATTSAAVCEGMGTPAISSNDNKKPRRLAAKMLRGGKRVKI